ncbi:MAG: potassium channel family protein [Candidatus Nanopelagicales bacterium]
MSDEGRVYEPDVAPGVSRVLFPSRRMSARETLVVRLLIGLGCIAATAMIVYSERTGYRDHGTGRPVTVLGAFYYATVTLSTTGYGDIVPVTSVARAVNTLVITPLRFLFLIVLVSTTVEVLTQAAREGMRVSRWRKRMKNHTVIIGFGVKGHSALKTLLAHGINPRELVVVAADRYTVAEATREGVTGVVGDARNEKILADAGVATAARIIVAADRDDTTIMITLRVSRMAPKAVIVAAARESAAAELLRQSGAHQVITTAESAGNLLGLSLLSPTVGEIVEDLMDSARGLEVVQRPITRAELGIAPSDLDRQGEIVLAVVRGGNVFRFDQGGVRVFERGDDVVVIRNSEKVEESPAKA